MSDYSDPFDFVSNQKWITLTAIGSVFTFTFINKIKEYILFPTFNYIVPKKAFESFNIVLEENEKKDTTLEIGKIIRELILWAIIITFIYFIAKKSKWPVLRKGQKLTILEK
tara:strand:+ start:1715 stop:2050 length:336 start_codon:yes stop_codon:yes gene_type:complete